MTNATVPDGFYATELHPKLSQGDILRDIPWGLIDTPLTICRPQQPKDAAGKASYGAPANFTSPAAFRKAVPEILHMQALQSRAIVLWHDCQLDKFEKQGKPRAKWFTTVAPVFTLSDMEEGSRQIVREGRRRAFFYMPAAPAIGIESESYVDLRYALSVRHSLLESQRVATLSTAARQSLYLQYFTFLTRLQVVNSIACPHCSGTIPIGDAFGDEDAPAA